MKRIILPILLLSLIFAGCSVNENTVIERVQDLESTQDMILLRVEALETTPPDLPPVECILPRNKPYDYIYTKEDCHKHNDIKLGSVVWFPYVGNWNLNGQELDYVIVEGQKVYYEKMIAVEIHTQLVDGESCIVAINGYGTTPQKTKEDMIKYIKDYFEDEKYWK